MTEPGEGEDTEHVLTVWSAATGRISFFRFNTPHAANTTAAWLEARGFKTITVPDDVKY